MVRIKLYFMDEQELGNGATNEQIFQAVAEVLGVFPFIVLGSVFGSAAKGRLRPASDIDIAVAAVRSLRPNEKQLVLDALDRRLKREVDLIDLLQVEGLILSQALAKGKIVLCRDRVTLIHLMEKIVYFDADLGPLVKRSLRTKAQRFAHG
jgi:predicted nucleotidyltransferase